jgi:hypothetical protein
MALGFAGLVVDARHTDPVGWVLWFGGLIAAHDGVVAPLAIAAGALVGMLPAPYRFPIRAALGVAGVLCLVALPMALGIGRRADDPSVLPLDYGRNLLLILAVIAVAAAATVFTTWLAARLRGRLKGRAGPGSPPG